MVKYGNSKRGKSAEKVTKTPKIMKFSVKIVHFLTKSENLREKIAFQPTKSQDFAKSLDFAQAFDFLVD